MTRLTPPVPGLWVPFAHRNCTHNEEISLRNRVIGEVPLPTRWGLSALEAEARRISNQLPTLAPMSRESFIDHFTGAKRSRYQQAADDLDLRPLNFERDGEISAFVKSEKFSPHAKENPDPRMIQARNGRFNTEVGVFLKPIEHHLYRLKSLRSGFPLLAKGTSMRNRGRVLWRIWSSFKNPVAIILDGSRWDKHITRRILEIEHGVYLRSINDPHFASLLELQLTNKCRTSGGWKYRVDGGRMSGDMNTALGNCLLMILMVKACFTALKHRFELYDDGDDVIVIVERENVDDCVAKLPGLYLEFGQEVKIESVAYRFEDIEFCQSRPVVDNTGEYAMVADWRKILSQSASGTRFWHEPTTRADMAYSVGQCLMALYPGMPIIQKYAQQLCASGGKLNPGIHNTDWIYKVRAAGAIQELGKLGPEPITGTTRESFAKAYGVTPIQQLQIEKQLSLWTLPEGTTDIAPEIGPGWRLDYTPGRGTTEWEWSPTTKILHRPYQDHPTGLNSQHASQEVPDLSGTNNCRVQENAHQFSHQGHPRNNVVENDDSTGE